MPSNNNPVEPVETGKTAYEIESELMGSSATRTGFGGRPEFINFYMDASDNLPNLSSLPKFRPIDIDFIKCGKMIPIVTVASAHGSSTMIFDTEVRVDPLENVIRFTRHDSHQELIYNIETGEWTLGE